MTTVLEKYPIKIIELPSGEIRYEVFFRTYQAQGKRKHVRRRFKHEDHAKQFLEILWEKHKNGAKGGYTDTQLIKAVQASKSLRQVLNMLGISPVGGSYAVLRRAIQRLKLDTSHFQADFYGNLQTKPGPKRPIEDYLSNRYRITSHKLRLRLIREGIFHHICDECGNTKWNGKPVPLELEHIDGNHNNNHLENLRLLCPNCHAQTPTYGSRNIGNIHYNPE